eukprot:5155263-Pyramimonas_sp.AAC.1
MKRIMDQPMECQLAAGPDRPRQHRIAAAQHIVEKDMQQDTLQQRKVGGVDHVFMEFAMAAPSLLLGRQGAHAPDLQILRGEYPATRLAPVQQAKPHGWLAETTL